MEQVITHLKEWRTELSTRTDIDSVEEKADRVGLVNSVEVAIKQLELCRTYGINPGSWFCVFPEKVSGYSEPMFRVVCDGEGDDPAGWKEISFADHGKVQFQAGDLAIKR